LLVKIEEPLSVRYKGVDVYNLQAVAAGAHDARGAEHLENADLERWDTNSALYLHTVYQAMSMAFADRDFYYGDPAFAEHQQPMKEL
jgi:gamma-glutamyltranspeptidase/glutathione hydrolase